MKKKSAVLIIVLLMGLIGTSVFANACCQRSVCEGWSDFSWSVKDNGVVHFWADHPASVDQYTWSFGDGKNYSSFNNSSFTHRYEKSRTYTVTLKARNVCGVWERTTYRVRVNTACCERQPRTKVYSTCGDPCGVLILGTLATLIFFSVL